MEFSRQEYWSGVPCLLQRIFPTQGSNPGLLRCRQILYCLSRQGAWLPPSLPDSLCMKTTVRVTLTHPRPHIAPVGSSRRPCHIPGTHASRTDRPEVGGTPRQHGTERFLGAPSLWKKAGATWGVLLQLLEGEAFSHVETCLYSPTYLFLLFSPSVVSNSLPPPGLQQARLPCPSPTPGVCSNPCLLSQ